MNLSRFSFSFRAIGLALLFVLASIPVYIGVRAVVTEVRTYQALKREHMAVLHYLGETITTTKDKDGKEVNVNRPMVLDAIIQQALEAAKQSAVPATPAGK